MRFLLARGADTRVIHLVRRERKAHAISYARASLSGRWRAAQEGEGRGEVAQAEEAQAEEAEPAQEGETPTTLFDWAQHDTERSTFI